MLLVLRLIVFDEHFIFVNEIMRRKELTYITFAFVKFNSLRGGTLRKIHFLLYGFLSENNPALLNSICEWGLVIACLSIMNMKFILTILFVF